MKKWISHKILKNTQGSTLVQMLVVTGVIGGLSMAVSTMISNVNKTQTATENAQFTTEVEDIIAMALRTNASCRATVIGTARVAGPNGANLASGSINEDIGGVVRPLVSVGQVLGGELMTTQGAGAGVGPKLTVDELRLITDPGGTPVTSYETGTPQNMTVANARIRAVFIRGDDTNATNESMQAQKAYGTNVIIREFPVQVLVNASNNIISCHAGEANVVQNFCNSLDARYRGDGKCLEIKIQEDGADATSNYAITSRQAMLVRSDGAPVQGGLIIGNDPAQLPLPGNINVQTDTDVGGNASVGGNLSVQGTGEIRENVAIGIPVTSPGGPRVVVAGNGARINKSGDGSTLSLLENAASVSDTAIRLTNNSPSLASFRVDSSVTTGQLMELYVGGSLHFSVSDLGVVTIPRPAAASSNTNPVAALDIGVNGQDYFAWRIFNQPASATTASHWQIVGSRGNEVATKRWAARSVYSFLETDTDSVGNITATLAGYSTNNQLLSIRRNICQNLTRVNHIMGEGHTGNIGNGVFASTDGGLTYQCTYSPASCNSAANRCGRLYVRGINSTGEILATGGSASVRVVGAGSVILNNDGTITATSNISSNTEVRSLITLRGTGTGASAGVCGAFGCASHFGHQFCPTGTVMIGMDRGTIQCGGGYW